MYDIILGRSESDREKYGTKGAILLGKQYVKMGQTTSLSSPIYMDVTRAHQVFICGKRGGGKCLHGDTMITLEDGSLVKIRELEENNQDIYALNSDLKIKQSAKSHFYKRDVNKLLKIKLRTGKELKLTPEHPLLTVKGWMPVEKLDISSRIATPRIVESFGDESLTEAETKILAYLTAEGHLSNNFILFSNQDEKIVNDFKSAIYNFDDTLQIKQHKEDCYRIVQNNKRIIESAERNEIGQFTNRTLFDSKSSLRKWLDKLNIYGKLAHERVLPDSIFKLPKNKTALFLNRLFSCDGTIWNENSYWKIGYSSSSKELANQVNHLLLKFGIVSFIRTKQTYKRPNYELLIRGEFVHTFLSEIGFLGDKEIRANTAIKETIKITRNPNKDTIPKEIWDLYKPDNWAEIGRKLNYSHPKALRESQRYSPSRQKLLQIAKADQSELLEKFACSDIYWDEIMSIEVLEGNFTVYDLTVPEHHNFIANNVIVHNSYTMGVVAEGFASLEPEIKNNLSIILLDTMGIYWTMKYPNHKEADLLKQWNIEPKALDVQIFTPGGFYNEYKEKGIPTDHPFYIKPSELSPEDWNLTFDLLPNDPIAILIEKTTLQMKKEGLNYDIEDMITRIGKDESTEKNVKNAAINRLRSTEEWGVFSKEGTKLQDLAIGGQVTVLDVSCYVTMPGGWKVKALVIGLVANKLFIDRMVSRKDEEFKQVEGTLDYFGEKKEEEKQKMPLVWLVIDEAHEFMPLNGKTAATDALVTVLREGRQPGISMILATQQPGKIHTDVMTQSDIIISHRVTAKLDTEALGMLMQSFMRAGLDEELNNLPRVKGSAILIDDTNERMFPMRVRPRFTWHGGESPNAMPTKKIED